MAMKDIIINILKELKNKGYKGIKIKDIVRIVIEKSEGKIIYPQSVYNTIKMLEMNSIIETTKALSGEKVIDLQNSKI